jgi:hypothetical protein
MVDYILTAHAEIVIAKRSIKREWLERILLQPELTEPDDADPELTHALGRVSEYVGRVLRVV